MFRQIFNLRVITQSPISRSFSTSTITQSKKSILKLRARERKEINELRQRYILEKKYNVDPVLGLSNNPFLNRLDAEVKEPNVLGSSYDISEIEKLIYGAKEAKPIDNFSKEAFEASSQRQKDIVLRILNMKNRSEEEILKYKVNLARQEFQRFEGDTGSSEVQAAIATVKIHHLYKHVQQNKKDFQNTRILRMLIQKRQRILKYLKKDQPERYFYTINKLGLTDDIVHMEFNFDRRYMQNFKMFGDRVLIKESKSVKEEERKQKRKENKILKRKSLKELRSMKKSLEL
ncbi:hypothetical protein WICMUC_000814 [Wickerhamomyces mucosus]|uniref:37S ribosomal protein S28, mitochondrial n=1 Tax=Wickerhamomyces mucosus TaxID=1378264 RepID=A0A9P8PYL7_9ASCO|nr:hypothetical protein WICMUC_000814 [Wickerhamomyces mucosus]